jgi:hypothetical protein
MTLHVMTDHDLDRFPVANEPGSHDGAVFLKITDQILHLLKSICLTMRRLALTERLVSRILHKIRVLQADD